MSTPPFVDLPDGVTVERWPVRGTQRAVMHAGLADTEAWVLLIPGFTGSKEDFIAVLPLLAQAGVGALAFDQLGQFESDGSDEAADYDLAALAADVAEVAGQVRQRTGRPDAPHLVGHSFGGLVAQEAVAGGHLLPSSLVLMCTGPGALSGPRAAELPALVSALDEHDLGTIWQVMNQWEEQDEADEGLVPSREVRAFVERRWHANHPMHLRTVALVLLEQPALTDRLRAGLDGVPVTVMWGELDDAWPREVQADMARRLDAPGVELPGLGHSPNAQDPVATVGALLRAWGR